MGSHSFGNILTLTVSELLSRIDRVARVFPQVRGGKHEPTDTVHLSVLRNMLTLPNRFGVRTMIVPLGTKCSALGCDKDAAYYGLHKRCEHFSYMCWRHMGNAKRAVLDRTKVAFCWSCGELYNADETFRRRTEFVIYPIERIG